LFRPDLRSVNAEKWEADMGRFAGLGLLGILVVFAIWGFGQYNGLVRSDETVKSSWSQVENAYQRRMDLIPNLVETVRGVAEFEQETYTQVAQARSAAGNVKLSPELLNDPEAFKRFEETQGQLSSALSRLLVTVEKYPDLKAQANFSELQTQLEGTENRITVERKRFNDVTREYNTTVRRFPASLIAGMTGFRQKPYFESREGADVPPPVKF
jgi:LemA protein